MLLKSPPHTMPLFLPIPPRRSQSDAGASHPGAPFIIGTISIAHPKLWGDCPPCALVIIGPGLVLPCAKSLSCSTIVLRAAVITKDIPSVSTAVRNRSTSGRNEGCNCFSASSLCIYYPQKYSAPADKKLITSSTAPSRSHPNAT
jgi:hypothetical protein